MVESAHSHVSVVPARCRSSGLRGSSTSKREFEVNVPELGVLGVTSGRRTPGDRVEEGSEDQRNKPGRPRGEGTEGKTDIFSGGVGQTPA